MNKTTTVAAHAHAIAEYPRESCGLVITENRKEVYVPCRNVAATPSEHFIMNPMDYANSEDRGKIKALVHSHPNAPAKPSDADRVACEASGVPWHIISVYKSIDDEGAPPKVHGETAFKPNGYRAPLVGREFSFGVLDCFTLVQDYYDWELGIKLPTPPRRDRFWERGEELYLKNFKKWGFSEVAGPIQPGDVILMQVKSDVTNHAAVFLGDVPNMGNNLMLHHLYDRPSGRDVYGGYWSFNTRYIVRKD